MMDLSDEGLRERAQELLARRRRDPERAVSACEWCWQEANRRALLLGGSVAQRYEEVRREHGLPHALLVLDSEHLTKATAACLDLHPPHPPGPGPYEFAKLSLSSEGPHLRVLLVVRDYDGRKLHVWQLVPRESSRARLEEAIAEMWRRLAEA